ncbi:SRPBCC family protein [Pendulispora brunnea]|uniref:SRPBCC family protein n=1 Tax=Pendulispora brunnea TaxID=2905690 RepID=A0ABZ2JXF6_9BACT
MTSEWTDRSIVKKETVIQAPPEKIFAILEDLSNLEKYIPGASKSTPVGDSYQVTYTVKLAGIADFPIQVKLRTESVQKPKSIKFTADGGFKGTLSWTLHPEGNGTRVSVEANYQMLTDTFRSKLGTVGKLLGGVADSLNAVVANVFTVNEANTGRALENLKKLSES